MKVFQLKKKNVCLNKETDNWEFTINNSEEYVFLIIK